MDRQNLLTQMQHGRQELLNALNHIPDHQMEVPALWNDWSVKDFISHLGFWEKRALEMYHYFADGVVPDPKPGTVSLDEINAWAFSANHNLTLQAARSQEQDAYQALIKLVETAPHEALFDPQHFPQTEGRAFAHWIEDNTFGHFEEHLPEFRAWLNLPGWIQYSIGEKTARAYAAHPKQGGPGVLVLHAWWGLNAFFRRLCDRLAEQGFVALAPDLYAGKLAGTINEAQALLDGRDSAYMETAALSAVERLRRQPGVQPGPLGAIGFSMGADFAAKLSAAQPEEIGAAVLFYGAAEADFHRARAAYQGHFAENDEWEPEKWVRWMESEMKAAGRETDLFFYPGTGHWFFEDDRPDAYNAEAASQAWERTLAFLRAKLGG